MKLSKPLCPECGEPAVGTIERIFGVTRFDGNPALGEVEHKDETDINWDSQETVTQKEGDKELLLVTCDNVHEWYTEIMPSK